MKYLLAALSGSLLSLAFPKFGLSFFAFAALIPFFYAVDESRDAREASFLGLLFGLVFFGVNLSWVNILSLYVGHWANTGWALLVLFQALYAALYAYLIKRHGLTLSFWGALLWGFMEFLRGIGPFGVAGGALAYSQAGFLHFIQITSMISVYGVSSVIVMINIAAARSLRSKDHFLLMATIVLMLSVLLYGHVQLGTEPPSGGGVTVSLIQGNIPQERKLNPAHNNENFNVHVHQSRFAMQDSPDIIIWPETANFSYLMYDKRHLDDIRKIALETGAYFLIGAPHYDRGMKAYNSVFVFDPSGDVAGRYDKQQLVPFGEYLPFKPVVYPFLKGTGFFAEDFNPGPESLPVNAKGLNIGVLICFESTFPGLARRRVLDGADILLVVTNDAWFRDSSAPYEHFDHTVFRAIENRKYVIQAANTGISGVVDPYGRVLNKTELNWRGSLAFKIPLPENNGGMIVDRPGEGDEPPRDKEE